MYKALEKGWDFEPNSNISRLKLFLALYKGQKYKYSTIRALGTVAGNSGTPRGSRALAEGGVAANIRVVSNTTHYQEFKKRENARKIKIKIEMN